MRQQEKQFLFATTPPVAIPHFSDILYVDDTCVLGTYTPHLNALIKAIQTHSAYYCLKLNLKKCSNITANRKQSRVRFMDNTEVPREDMATYLGAVLSDDFDNFKELNNRIAACNNTIHRMKIFWGKAENTTRWKIKVFDDIIRSKLLYGFETIQLKRTELNRLDGFQARGYTRILKIPFTHIDRSISNEDTFRIVHLLAENQSRDSPSIINKQNI